MQDTTAINPAYEELRARLPESEHDSFDESVEAGCPVEILAEEVERYLAMMARCSAGADVPQEAKDGLDRMLEAGEALQGLPDEEVVRLYREHLMVKRAGDFTAARRKRFMVEAGRVRKHATRREPRARGAGRPATRRPKAHATRSSAKSGDSGDESEPPEAEPPERRYCQNRRCGADITYLDTPERHGPPPEYCPGGACKQQAWRDRETIKLLDEKAGTIVERLGCVCDPPRNLLEPDHCHQCGKPRGVITCGWVDERGVAARGFVVAAPVARIQANNRKRAAKLRSENLRKRKSGEHRWDEPDGVAA